MIVQVPDINKYSVAQFPNVDGNVTDEEEDGHSDNDENGEIAKSTVDGSNTMGPNSKSTSALLCSGERVMSRSDTKMADNMAAKESEDSVVLQQRTDLEKSDPTSTRTGDVQNFCDKIPAADADGVPPKQVEVPQQSKSIQSSESPQSVKEASRTQSKSDESALAVNEVDEFTSELVIKDEDEAKVIPKDMPSLSGDDPKADLSSYSDSDDESTSRKGFATSAGYIPHTFESVEAREAADKVSDEDEDEDDEDELDTSTEPEQQQV